MAAGSRDQTQDLGLPRHLTHELSYAVRLPMVFIFPVEDIVVLHRQLYDIDGLLEVNYK